MFYISFGGTMLGVRLEKDVEYRLNHLCDETGHTKSYYVKKAIKELIGDIKSSVSQTFFLLFVNKQIRINFY